MISVITPVFHGQHYIEPCIKSVIEQKCPTVEHIIVDGGSTDGTVEIIRRYAADYLHIRWVSEKDRGQSDAMNKGIAMARGRVIGFLNVDDFYEPNVLSRVTEIFEALPEPSMAVANCKVWDNDGKLWWVNRPAKLGLVDLLLGSDINPFPVNPSAYFYHKSLHDMVGLYAIDENYTLDLDFLLRAVQAASVRYYDETWGNFSLVEGTKTMADIRSGQLRRREREVLIKYRKCLPFFLGLRVAFLYYILNSSLGASVRYFRHRPGEIAPRLLIRLKALTGVERYLWP